MDTFHSTAPIQIVKHRSEDNQPVTAVISQRVLPHHEAEYERWMQGITEAAKQFPGHSGVMVIRPEAGICVNFVVILKFDCYAHLKAWLDLPLRQQWLDKAKPFLSKPERVDILTGFETWFTLPAQAVKKAPPRYKMALLTTLAVFVAVQLINPILLPLLVQFLPPLLAALIATDVVANDFAQAVA
ncbi:MAG: antibiotic biosynthesis monooxygenase [Synechococcales cyanobacterium RM1_1_8]|nr:antibiotic biosynthesis monooxygenase [Synechococcales cyanobacterium RM1_1_8]